jgi:hypothetical protein
MQGPEFKTWYCRKKPHKNKQKPPVPPKRKKKKNLTKNCYTLVKLKKKKVWVWWHIPVIPALEGL